MIEGVKVDVRAEELMDHLTGAALAHREKAQAYARQRRDLLELQSDNPAMSNDPGAGLARSHDQHREKADYYDWLARHLVKGETYRLSQHDLREIGIVGGGW